MLVLRNHQQAIAIIGLCAYVIAAFGFLPAPSMVRNLLGIHGGERFPCESHACGCFDAETCLTDCCCFAPSEVRAWAESNGLDPVGWAALDTEPAHPESAAEEPMPDDCPMCQLGETAPQQEEPLATAGIELPQVAPLGCKQIGQWLLLTPPITISLLPAELLTAPVPARPARRIGAAGFPARSALEIPDPPPRTA